MIYEINIENYPSQSYNINVADQNVVIFLKWNYTGEKGFWTLTLTDADGRLVENAAGRHGFTSTEVVWNRDGTLDIALGPRARAGNWLPTGARDRLTLTLRLYDAPVGLASRTSEAPDMPRLVTERCP